MNQQRIFLIAGKITLVVFIGLSGFFTLSESAVAARRSRGTAVRPNRRGTQSASCSKSLSSKESLCLFLSDQIFLFSKFVKIKGLPWVLMNATDCPNCRV